jgi:two-component system response regulator YesN
MIKVFLVEDEPIIRKSIRENIDWEKEGFQFCGEAGDGEIALPLIRIEKPDILITDVKMPFMDGLELAELVRKELPTTKILILSGFRDFDFAKKAISIGVTDYLSKPITSERLLDAIKQVAKRIKDEQEESSLVKTYQQEMAEKYILERNVFFNHLLEKRKGIPELITEGERLGLNLVSPWYTVLLCKFLQREESKASAEEVQKATEQVTQAFQDTEGMLVFGRGFDGIAIILEAASPSGIAALSSLVAKTLGKIGATYPLTQYFGGVGSMVNRLSELSHSYQEANKAFSSRFFTSSNQVVMSEGSPHDPCAGIPPMVDPSSLSWHHLEEFFSIGMEEEIPGFCEQYLRSIGECNCEVASFRTYVAMNAYYCALSFPAVAALSKESRGSLGPDIASIRTVSDLSRYLSELLGNVLAERNRQANRKYYQQTERAKQFIIEHVGDFTLSLNTVADSIPMSPNYFSTIFSQEAGKTFIEFLTETRMQKAEELLRTTTMRPSDIALEVGYQDSHYFSYLFKKLVGCTPKEFRDRGSR